MVSALHRVLNISESTPITHDLFERLIAEKVREQTDLDYKATAYDFDDETKRFELAKDICAMANSGGGWIICGLGEKKEIPTGFSPLNLDPKSETKIRELIEKRIEPSLQIDIYVVSRDDDTDTILAIKIPDSAQRPHLLRAKKTADATKSFVVPVRDGARTAWIGERELRKMYTDQRERSEQQEAAQNEYFADAVHTARKFIGTSLVIVAVPQPLKETSSWTADQIRKLLVPKTRYRYIDRHAAGWDFFDAEKGIDIKRDFQKEVVTFSGRKGVLELHIYDNGTVQVIAKLGNIAGDDLRAASHHPVGTPSHVRNVDVEFVLGQAIGVIDQINEREPSRDIQLFARLVYEGNEPIQIRRMDAAGDLIMGAEASEPISIPRTVVGRLPAQRDETDVQKCLYRMASDLINQSRIRSPQYIKPPESA